jgi:hypothetical protein
MTTGFDSRVDALGRNLSPIAWLPWFFDILVTHIRRNRRVGYETDRRLCFGELDVKHCGFVLLAFACEEAAPQRDVRTGPRVLDLHDSLGSINALEGEQFSVLRIASRLTVLIPVP